MSQAIEHPLEFLKNAREAAAQYEQISEEQEALEEQKRQLAQRIENHKRVLADRTEATLKRRRAELESGYDQQLKQIEAHIKKIGTARDKAKNQGVKERIAAETEHLVKDTRALKNELAAVLKKDRAPAFCKTDLYYALFYPHSIREFLLCLFAFVLLFAVLPSGIFYLLPKRRSLYLVVIYLLDIVIFGGLYIKINQMTRIAHENAVRKGRALKDNMRANRKKIRAITHAVRADISEDGYDLREFDDELAKTRQELADVAKQKQDALNTFENVTRNIITDELENSERPEQDALQEEAEEIDVRLLALRPEKQKAALTLATDYEPYLGKEHTNTTDIDKLISLIHSGEANGLSEASAKLK